MTTASSRQAAWSPAAPPGGSALSPASVPRIFYQISDHDAARVVRGVAQRKGIGREVELRGDAITEKVFGYIRLGSCSPQTVMSLARARFTPAESARLPRARFPWVSSRNADGSGNCGKGDSTVCCTVRSAGLV